MLSIENLTVRYGEFTALDHVTFSLQEGQWLMLAGPNGSGKSTLLEAIANCVPYEGTITLKGKNIRKFSAKEYARSVGVLSQHNSVGWSFTVEQLVQLGRYAHTNGYFAGSTGACDTAVSEALETTGLLHLKNANVMNLSGGELQRAFLAQVFAQEPEILILDEPANHLDIAFQKSVFSLISEWVSHPGRAVLSTVHDLPLARKFATDAVLLSHGKLVSAGKPDIVFSDRNLKSVYETDVSNWIGELYRPWALSE